MSYKQMKQRSDTEHCSVHLNLLLLRYFAVQHRLFHAIVVNSSVFENDRCPGMYSLLVALPNLYTISINWEQIQSSISPVQLQCLNCCAAGNTRASATGRPIDAARDRSGEVVCLEEFRTGIRNGWVID